MFHDSSYMGGMHFWWWAFWCLALVATLVFVWQRGTRQSGAGARTSSAKPYRALRRRLANGTITPLQYEEHKALLDRDR